MPESKVRGWDGKKFVYLDYGNPGSDHLWQWHQWINKIVIPKNSIYHYTGFKDKKGNEIWENSITRTESELVKLSGIRTGRLSITLERIVWCEDEWGWEIFKNIEGHTGKIPFVWKGQLKIHAQYCEVIGSTDENPELLKEEELCKMNTLI